MQYCRELLKQEHYDFFIFGHRHLPVDVAIKPDSSGSVLRDPEGESRYINLGDWITWFTYAVFDEAGMRLMKRAATDLIQDDRQVTGGPAK